MKKFFEALGIPFEDIVGMSESLVAQFIIEALAPRECGIVLHYYGINCQKKAVKDIALADEFHVTESRIRQICKRAVRRIKQSPKKEELVALVKEERWAKKDKDLQELRGQVQKLSADFRTLSLYVARVCQSIQIADPTKNPEQKPGPVMDFLTMKIDELELAVRTTNCLKIERIYTFRDLLARSESELLETPNLGRRSINEIREALAIRGLFLR